MAQYEFKTGKNSEPLMDGTRGRVGQFVFRLLNGVTVVSRRPKKPTYQSLQQRDNRNRFRLATAFAKQEMLDPERKAYYKAIADKFRLRNAYTAAIKAYMNMPETTVRNIKESLASKVIVRRQSSVHRMSGRAPVQRRLVVRSVLLKPKARMVIVMRSAVQDPLTNGIFALGP